MREYLFGRRAILESLRAKRRAAVRLWAVSGGKPAGVISEILEAARKAGVPVREAAKPDLDRMTRSGNHQGWVLETGSYPYASESDLWAGAESAGEPPFFLLLDHIHDPQNVGSLLRTADAVGIHGVLIPKDRAAGITPAVVRASSGAAEHLRIVAVANVAQTIDRLKKREVWVCGLDAGPDASLFAAEPLLGEAVALVVGNEGRGLARLTRERCDARIGIPMFGRVQSLNAAVSGSIALYEVRRRRGWKPERSA